MTTTTQRGLMLVTSDEPITYTEALIGVLDMTASEVADAIGVSKSQIYPFIRRRSCSRAVADALHEQFGGPYKAIITHARSKSWLVVLGDDMDVKYVVDLYKAGRHG